MSEINSRREISLDGEWLFQQDHTSEWKRVQVPSSFQSHEGTNFHGIGWYTKTVDLAPLPKRRRMLIHFQAAATAAEIWWDDQRLGSHLGGWTPFRFDITELLRHSTHRNHTLRVRVDEKVGHNTQGFLPVIAPHFGGLWQKVTLLEVPETYIDDLSVMAIGNPKTSELRLELPLAGTPNPESTNLSLQLRLRGQESWSQLACQAALSNGVLHAAAKVAGAKPWSPENPNLYELEISLHGGSGDRIVKRLAFRSIEAFGPELRLNGHPLQIRGLLNWGFSPPRVEPNPGEAQWRTELEFAKAHGFNLVKFCLWVPPHRYLEMADEVGMLAWMEYPTWHPNLSKEFLEPLTNEFNEFFRYDRNHPSVVLRSLTCETGTSADLDVIKNLYDSAHQLMPGALVEDDSSWIAWNRVHDFYDDHPYGNNHTWVKTLRGFNEYILAHGLKPMLLGEAIAADTWLDRDALLHHFGAERPWYAPGVLDTTGSWLNQMRGLAGPGGLESLRADSLRYGLLMRKYQIEAYRREIPYGGYVISVIRDIPNASMGLVDYLDRPKWSAAEWAWQRDTICLLKTPQDQRSFRSGDQFNGEILVSHFGLKPIVDGKLETTLQQVNEQSMIATAHTNLSQNPGTLAHVLAPEWKIPEVNTPKHWLVSARLTSSEDEFRNEWPIWVVPKPSMPSTNELQIHTSVSGALRGELFPVYASFEKSVAAQRVTVVASRFDAELVDFLDRGGRVLLLPDGQTASLPLTAHWFLRGAPYVPDSALTSKVPRDLLIELQHFDLASDVITNLPLESLDPLLMLWDTHDQQTVKTHGIIFETRAGAGRLLVSTARHGGANNPAGHWLLGVLLEYLRSSPTPRHSLSAEAWQRVKAQVSSGAGRLDLK